MIFHGALKELLWYYSFLVFCELKHPTLGPTKVLRKIVRMICNTKLHPQKTNTPPKVVPKKIWIFWAQGWDVAPRLVQLCRDSWIIYNPEWKVVLLSDDTISKYIKTEKHITGENITYAAYSDVVRIKLLSKYGGVWTDATTFCSSPLSTWLPSLMQSGFFAFSKPKTTIASWFIASEKNNFLTKYWGKYVDSYWKFAKKPERYFWFHYLFEYILTLVPKVREVWSQTPKVSADGPYAAQRCLKNTRGDKDECFSIIWSNISPVHKLDWKMEIPEGFLRKIEAELSKLPK